MIKWKLFLDGTTKTVFVGVNHFGMRMSWEYAPVLRPDGTPYSRLAGARKNRLACDDALRKATKIQTDRLEEQIAELEKAKLDYAEKLQDVWTPTTL